MSIRGPKGSIPTQRGWIDPQSGELLKVQKISTEQIVDWYNPRKTQTLHEAPYNEQELTDSLKNHYYDYE